LVSSGLRQTEEILAVEALKPTFWRRLAVKTSSGNRGVE